MLSVVESSALPVEGVARSSENYMVRAMSSLIAFSKADLSIAQSIGHIASSSPKEFDRDSSRALADAVDVDDRLYRVWGFRVWVVM